MQPSTRHQPCVSISICLARTCWPTVRRNGDFRNLGLGRGSTTMEWGKLHLHLHRHHLHLNLELAIPKPIHLIIFRFSLCRQGYLEINGPPLFSASAQHKQCRKCRMDHGPSCLYEDAIQPRPYQVLPLGRMLGPPHDSPHKSFSGPDLLCKPFVQF